jgi:hypothetical protein
MSKNPKTMAENPLLFIPCSIENVSTRKDKTLRITIGTQELTPDKTASLMTLWASGYGVMCFKGEQFSHDEQEIINSIKLSAQDLGAKTPSERLRNTLYVLFKDDPKGFQTFDAFYLHHMEEVINMIKRRLDKTK